MFKKTLLAATLAALSTSAMAIDVATNSTKATYGSEALTSTAVANDGSVLTLGATQLLLGAEYSVGDTITINISGGEFDPTDAFELTDTDGALGTVGITTGLLSATKTQLLFRVTALDTTNGLVTTGQTLDLELAGAAPVPLILSSTSAGSKVNITASGATSTGLAIDVKGSDKDTFNVGEVLQEHKFTVTAAMAAQIDVSKERKEFVTPANATFTVTHSRNAVTQASYGSNASTVKATLTGSLAAFENTVAGTDNKGTVVGTGAAAYTVAADLATATRDLGTVDLSGGNLVPAETVLFTVDPTAATREVINVGAYTFDVELNTANKVHKVSGLAAGNFSLNGSSAQYAYAPVNFNGAVTTQFEVGNKGSVDGEISLSAFDTAGNKYSAMLPFKAEAGKLTRISDADIANAFGLTKGTKLNLTITVNAPSGDITYGAYSNRGTTGRMAINKL